MTNKGEVSFSEECKRLLDLRDPVGTKGDNNMRNANLNQD